MPRIRDLEELGVKRHIAEILLSVIPNGSLVQHWATLRAAVRQPSHIARLVDDVGNQLGLAAISHAAMRARAFLDMPQFHLFTRDYVRRCCDLIEHVTRDFLALRLPITITNQPLGEVVRLLRRFEGGPVPKKLLDDLGQFNKRIYRPAKHERLSEGALYNVADAVAITFIAIVLCRDIQETAYQVERAVPPPRD